MTKKAREPAEEEVQEQSPVGTEPQTEETPPPAEEKKEDLQERFLRLAADFDNFRKRVQKEKAEYIRYSTENVMKELLPVLDNFERAMDHAQKSADADSLHRGVELIFNQLRNSLSKFGLHSESALGKPFDPLIHEAVTHLPSADYPPHTVMEEIQKAYFLNDRLIRPALVAVSKESEPAAPAEESGPQTD